MIEIDDNIELMQMPSDPNPISTGTKGKVTSKCPDPFYKGGTIFGVDWENGRTLNAVCPPDIIRKTEP